MWEKKDRGIIETLPRHSSVGSHKAYEKLVRIGRYPSQDSNPAFCEYKPGILKLELT
jgi:hypothetical protein